MNSNQHNKIINVSLKGGLIGLFADSPQNTLNKAVIKQNKLGYRVVQVIPAHSGSILLFLLRLILLFITFFFYTTANGFYLILEKSGERNKMSNTKVEVPTTVNKEKANIDDLFN